MYKRYSRECAWCGKLFETNRQDKLCCNYICSSHRNRHVAKLAYKKKKGKYNKNIKADNASKLEIKYKQYQYSAEKRRLIFKLSFKEFKSLLRGKCYYCDKKPNPFSGIDRVDSSVGYVKKNSVSCCVKCNRMKLTMSKREFAAQILRLQKWAKCEIEKSKPIIYNKCIKN